MTMPNTPGATSALRHQAVVYQEKYQRVLESHRRAYNRLTLALLDSTDTEERRQLEQQLDEVRHSIARVDGQTRRWGHVAVEGRDATGPYAAAD